METRALGKKYEKKAPPCDRNKKKILGAPKRFKKNGEKMMLFRGGLVEIMTPGENTYIFLI